MRISIAVLLIMCCSVSNAQTKWLQTNVLTSYSGVSQTLTYNRQVSSFNYGLGILQNYSQAAFPWSQAPGLCGQLGFELVSNEKLTSNVQLFTMFYPSSLSRFTEAYAGYDVKYDLSERWGADSFVSFGVFNESGPNGSYVIGGFSYCVSFGISYRL